MGKVLFLRTKPLVREMVDIQIRNPPGMVRVSTERGLKGKPRTWFCLHVCHLLSDGASPFLSLALGFLIAKRMVSLDGFQIGYSCKSKLNPGQ